MLLAASFCQQAATMSAYKFTQRAVAFPAAPQKPCANERALGGANWVKVTRKPGRQAKKPRTTGSQQPACPHKEHQNSSTAEATAFAAQFWDRKDHLHKVSQHEFLATCTDVDLEQSQLLWRGATMTTTQIKKNQWSLELWSVLCIVTFVALCSKM